MGAVAMKGTQLTLPLPKPRTAIDAGVQHLFLARLRSLRIARRRAFYAAHEHQLALQLRIRAQHFNKRSGRPTKYPFFIVAEARKMRAAKFEYKEIAEFLSDHFRADLQKAGIEKIPWITVRDWVMNYYRCLG